MSCYTNLFIFVLVYSILSPRVTSTTRFTSTSSVLLSESESNATIKSPANIFTLGIFRKIIDSESTITSQPVDEYYIGIWPTKIPGEVVWVANRDKPFLKSEGTLKVSNGSLTLVDGLNNVIWDIGLPKRSGSFESFEFPTDTILPGMDLESDNFTLTAWDTPGDPYSGAYTFEVNSQGKLSEGCIWHRGGQRKHCMGPSLGTNFNMGEPTEALRQSTNASYYAGVRLMSDGILLLRVWTSTDGEIKSPWRLPSDECDVFKICSQNMYCEMSPLRVCKCIEGFEEIRHSKSKQMECVKLLEPDCSGDVFKKMSNTKLPAADASINIVHMVVGFEECERKCFKDCMCTAYAIMDTGMRNGTMACALWEEPLEDVRTYNTTTIKEGHDLYIRLPLAHLKTKGKNKQKAMIIGFSVGGSVLLIIISLIYICWEKFTLLVITAKLEDINQTQPVLIPEDHRSIVMDFEDIATATDRFAESNKLGTGGFGIVYKGRLTDEQEIAVKKLTTLSQNAVKSFENEVKIIGVIQHINLVRLLGYVSTRTNKLLVYEYLENRSLDTYLYDTTRRYILTWERRFEIIIGIVRGLVYLHQDSRFKIIHLDIKPNNILLGKDMVPKISDFGLAKTLESDVTEGHVSSTAGTWGYMPLEYRMDHVYSAKSDVFNFGVTLLEIISGKKNREFYRVDTGETLQSYIWSNWSQGKGLEMVDPVIKDTSFPSDQLLRCMQIGLLCVQQLAEDRPIMSSVAMMLASQTETVAQPKNPKEIPSSSSSSSRGDMTQGESCYTMNQITLSVCEGR